MDKMETREEGDDLFIEGYFAVFNTTYELWPGATESIAPGAFDESVSDDVRALYNHNTDIVLGRTSAGTMEIRQDSRGLWGCSFGFDIAAQETDYREDGTVHWTITRVSPLYEISPCTFPAYQETTVSARKHDLEEIKRKRTEVWKHRAMERLHGTQ